MRDPIDSLTRAAGVLAHAASVPTSTATAMIASAQQEDLERRIRADVADREQRTAVAARSRMNRRQRRAADRAAREEQR